MEQSMLFECMTICTLSPAHESEMRGYLVYLLIITYLLILCKFSHSRLDLTALSWIWGGYDICVLSTAHESEMRGYLVYVLIVEYLSHRFCLNSATVY